MHVKGIKTKFDKDAPVIDGYPYDKNNTYKNKVHWRCYSCRIVKATSEENHIIEVRGQHGHPPDSSLVLRSKFKQAVKKTLQMQPQF